MCLADDAAAASHCLKLGAVVTHKENCSPATNQGQVGDSGSKPPEGAEKAVPTTSAGTESQVPTGGAPAETEP